MGKRSSHNSTDPLKGRYPATNKKFAKTSMINYKTAAALLAVSACLSACGGGGADDNQQITQVQIKTLAYGQQAVVYIAGVYLRSDMTASTGVCKNPVFNTTQSLPELAVLNCTVTTTGQQPLTITGSNGQVLYSGTLTVPQPQVILVTSLGSVTLELNPTAAPLTVNNFLAYVNNGYYANTLFHRVIPGFVAQGGGYTTGLVKKAGQSAPIALETNKGLLNVLNSVAMARTTDPNSATSEFFFNLADNPSLDYQSAASPGYAVFGKVVQGMDIVAAIGAVPTATTNGVADVPVSDVTIKLALQTQ